MVTWFGFLVTIVGAVLILTDHLLAAGIVVLVAGFFDMLDGALARHTRQITRFGGILDSTLDRLSEAALLFGILALSLGQEAEAEIWLAFIVLFSSFVVSYIRARAEGAGLKCQVGLFTRTERVIILALGLILNQLLIALSIIALLSLVTIVHRMLYVWQQSKTAG